MFDGDWYDPEPVYLTSDVICWPLAPDGPHDQSVVDAAVAVLSWWGRFDGFRIVVVDGSTPRNGPDGQAWLAGKWREAVSQVVCCQHPDGRGGRCGAPTAAIRNVEDGPPHGLCRVHRRVQGGMDGDRQADVALDVQNV